jgi:hypothetical protein
MRMISPQLDVDDLTAIIRESMAAQQKRSAAGVPPVVEASQTVTGEQNLPTLKMLTTITTSTICCAITTALSSRQRTALC